MKRGLKRKQAEKDLVSDTIKAAMSKKKKKLEETLKHLEDI